MKPFATIVLVLCIYLSGSDSAGLFGKSVIFPTQTKDSFVKLNARDFTSMAAFTACFRTATEATYHSLLSYETSSSANELLIWEQSKTELWLYLGEYANKFHIPDTQSLLRHVCVTWESKGGETTVWVNGRRSAGKVAGEGHVVKGTGQFILGRGERSTWSFVGEITDVNMWDRVLKPNQIELISQGCYSDGGNMIDWGSTTFTPAGNVIIKDNNDCTL